MYLCKLKFSIYRYIVVVFLDLTLTLLFIIHNSCLGFNLFIRKHKYYVNVIYCKTCPSEKVFLTEAFISSESIACIFLQYCSYDYKIVTVVIGMIFVRNVVVGRKTTMK